MLSAPWPARLLDALPWRAARRGAVLRALLLLGLCELVRTGLYVGFLPQLLAAKGLALSAAGLAWGVHYATDTLCRSPGGHLVERYGLRRVVLAGAALALACTALIPLLPGLVPLLVLAALHGAALSPLWPAVMTLSSASAGEEGQARATSVVSALAGPFTGIGFLGIGALSSAYFGHPAAGTVRVGMAGAAHGFNWPLTALLLCQGAALLLALSVPAGALHSPPDPLPGTGAADRPHLPAHTPARLRRTLTFLIPAALIQTLGLSLLGPVITPFAARVGLGQWGVTALLAVGAVTAYALLAFTGRLADRRGARPLLIAGLLLAALGLGLMATLPPLWGYFALAAVLGAGYACLLPGWGGLVAQLLPQQHRAAAWGVVMSAENVGMAGGPLLGTLAWDSLGQRSPFLLGTLLFVLTATVYLWPGRRPAQGGSAEQRCTEQRGTGQRNRGSRE